MTFSRRLAIVAGVLLPVVETARRWHQLSDVRPLWTWADDYVIALFLLYAAWRMGRDAVHGHRVLAAAWGFACALAFNSFFVQLSALDQADPSGLDPALVVLVKGVAASLAAIALLTTLRSHTAGSRADVE
jgi:hypothetical protein